jgi:hypothetical protein
VEDNLFASGSTPCTAIPSGPAIREPAGVYGSIRALLGLAISGGEEATTGIELV